MEEFDNEKFISEVQAHPILWNYRVDDYLSRQKRIKAWRDICLKCIPRFAEKSNQGKHNAAKKLQRRWKSYRDSFIREHRKQIQSSDIEGTQGRKPYRYYQNLSFLIKVINSSRSKCDPKESNVSNLTTLKGQPTSPTSATSANKEITQPENEITHIPPESPATSQTEVDEADRNFVLSLLPHFKHILDECKLDAQMDILMVLKKYKSTERHSESQYFSERRTSGSHDSVLASHPRSFPYSSDDCQVLSDDASITVSEDVKSLYY